MSSKFTLSIISAATIFAAVSVATIGYADQVVTKTTETTTTPSPNLSIDIREDLEKCLGVTKDGKAIMLPKGVCEQLVNGVVIKE